MGGIQPEGLTAMATRACSRKMAQLASSYDALDVSSKAVGETQILNDNRILVQLLVTIRYKRHAGIIAAAFQIFAKRPADEGKPR